MTDADKILFTDREGRRASLGDVILDGLEGGYGDRIPALVHVLRDGTPAQRLYAAVVLLSWGERAGYDELSAWSRDPSTVPWAGAPIVATRMSGADGAWEMLADGLKNSCFLDRADMPEPPRAQAATDLLRLADRVDYDRTLAMALSSADRDVLVDVLPALEAAVERSLERLAGDDAAEFDLATQTAGLLGSIAPLHDEAAAAYAGRLIELAPGNRRMLRDLVDALSYGTADATILRLRQLQASSSPGIGDAAESALRTRGAT